MWFFSVTEVRQQRLTKMPEPLTLRPQRSSTRTPNSQPPTSVVRLSPVKATRVSNLLVANQSSVAEVSPVNKRLTRSTIATSAKR